MGESTLTLTASSWGPTASQLEWVQGCSTVVGVVTDTVGPLVSEVRTSKAPTTSWLSRIYLSSHPRRPRSVRRVTLAFAISELQLSSAPPVVARLGTRVRPGGPGATLPASVGVEPDRGAY